MYRRRRRFSCHAFRCTILKAINVATVDYFSLDLEGAEFHVLKGIDLKSTDLRLFTVESEDRDHPENIDKLISYMENQGYEMVQRVHIDIVFRKK
jgi:hypothetical protein